MAPYVDYDEVGAVCSECGRQFPSDEALAAHREEAHAGVPSPAPAVRAAPQVRCAVCGHRFPSVSALARHNRAAHTG